MLVKMFNDFNRMNNKLDHVFNSAFNSIFNTKAMDLDVLTYPLTSIYQTEENYFIEMELPGLDKEKLEITLHGDKLNVKGTRTKKVKTENTKYFVYENSYSSFYENFKLPESVKKENPKADYKDGILTLCFERKKEESPKQIEINWN